MATQHNFRVKNGLEVAGTERISSSGVITGALASATTATTQSASDNSTKIATTAYTDAAITALVDSSPGALNTLNELAAALGDDAAFSTTVTNSIATKAPLASPSFTGNADVAGNVYVGTNDTILAENNLRFKSSGAAYIDHNTTGQSIVFRTSNSSSLDTTGLIIDHLGNTKATAFTAGTANPNAELLYLLGSGHTGHGASNTGSLVSIVESTSGNLAGLWFGSMTNENTGVIGSRTASGNIAFQTYNGSSWGERMRIDMAGKVSIGTTNTYNAEADNLIIFDSGNAGLTIATGSTSANNTIHFADGTSGDAQYRGVIEYAHNGDSMRFKVNGEQEAMRIHSSGQVGIGTTSITSGVNLQVNGGKIYVPDHGIQAQQAILQSNTTMNFAEQPASGNSYTSPAANKTMAVFGSNSSSTGVAIQRDIANGYPDFAVMPGGTTYFHGNTTQVGSGASNASMYGSEPGYVGIGRKIDNHQWKNWSGTGNYTARLYTPIVHTEGNMFYIEVDVYGYGSGGRSQKYLFSGYAYSGSSLIAHDSAALAGSLNHRVTTATHPTSGIGTVVVIELGHTANNGTSYYNHMRWRYQGWQQKNPADFIWGHVTT